MKDMKPLPRCPECSNGIECVDHWVARPDHMGERLAAAGVESEPEDGEEAAAIELMEAEA